MCPAAVHGSASSSCSYERIPVEWKYPATAQIALLDASVNKNAFSSSSFIFTSQMTTATTVITPPTRWAVSESPSTIETTSSTPARTTAVPSGEKQSLTILALGDSITSGYIAKGAYNSYRLALMNMLMSNTPLWNVTLCARPGAMYQHVGAVGNVRSGNFSQNNCEAYPAMQIDDIRNAWSNNSITYKEQPHVLLLLAGINDVVQNVTDEDTLQAVHRLAMFVDALITAYPAATVIVSTLTPTLIEDWKPQIKIFNNALPSVMQSRISEGKRILVVDMFLKLTVNDLADWVHPSAAGYVKMAASFLKCIQIAREKGWL